jgi:cobyrinic acid a,c-diamide synthase
MSLPRILIAGVSGGGGKTLASLGLAAAWRRQGRRVAAFKKGPDYIDAAWLSRAAGSPCRNLDLFMMSPQAVLRSFVHSSGDADAAVIEGNRGLYDGRDAKGSCSTAELAKLLHTPVVLVVDCTKATRTIAAIVLGCQQLDTGVSIRGVILNRVGGRRHEAVVRESIQDICGVPVLGAIPRLGGGELFPERHLGLVPPDERDEVDAPIEKAADAVEKHVDLDAVWQIAQAAPALAEGETGSGVSEARAATCARIGVFRDAAFQFYYPENLEALREAGGEIVEVSPIGDRSLAEVDALYIGGGFPETLAPKLSANAAFLASVREVVGRGLPVYAECGGAVFLGRSLVMEGAAYPMAGVLPAVFAFGRKPQGHGYTELETVGANPFYAAGSVVRGHEFHYTYVEAYEVDEPSFAFRVRSGFGFDGRHDGLCLGNVLAMYTHVHALGTVSWARSIVEQAAAFKARA